MHTVSIGLLIILSIGTFLLGGCIGGLIIYKIEEHNFKAMTEQCARLADEESALSLEREEYINNHSTLTTIDDVPEYLRDKYYSQLFTEDDEDISEIYT